MNNHHKFSLNAGWLASLILAGSLMAGCSAQNVFSGTGASTLAVSPTSAAYEPSAANKETTSGSGSPADPASLREFYLENGRTGWKIEAQTDETLNAGSTLYRTENGGAEWIELADSAAGSFPAGMVGAARFADENGGWIAVDTPQEGDPGLYGTRDGGATWSKTELKVPADFADTRFEPKTPIRFEGTELGIFIAQTGYAANGQDPYPLLFYVTSDGGAHWSDPIRDEEGEMNGLGWKTELLADRTGRSWSITIDGRTWTFERGDR